MRPVLYVMSFLAVLGLGFWAYTEHYNTREALRDVQALQAEIADLREALTLQRGEWAFLNRPTRLRELATLNFERLGLLPLEPGQFGEIGQVAYPAVEEFFGQIDNPVTIAGEQSPDREFP